MSCQKKTLLHYAAAALSNTLCLLLLSGCAFVTQVSVTPTAGVEPDGDSFDPVMSTSGRYVAFASSATNLVTNDTNAYKDIFVRDNQAGTTELISKSMINGSANNLSGQPDISANARYVVYWSFADDLVPADTNLQSDVFLYDRQTGNTERVSVDSNGDEAVGASLGGSVSDDGRYIVFYSTAQMAPNDSNNLYDIYKRDRQLGTTELVSVNLSGNAAGSCFDPVISRDGQSVMFWSSASDITSGDTNGFSDVFGITSFLPTTLNLTSGGNGHSYTGDLGTGFAPTIVYYSYANNLVAGDNNGVRDIFLLEWAGGNYARRRITDGNGASYNPVMSDTDPLQLIAIAFNSTATDLQEPGAQPLDTNGVEDVYLWERKPTTGINGVTRLMSQNFIGDISNAQSWRRPAISPNGSAVAFASSASNLVPEDGNGYEDVFARPTWVPTVTSVSGDLTAGETTVLSLSGKFNPTASPDQALLGGDGIISFTVNSVTYFSMTVTVELAVDATVGPRNIIVYHPAPQLGMNAPLGSADSISVNVVP